MLELRDVVKHHAAGEGEVVRAVDGVSLEVRGGELVALYGPSGCGRRVVAQGLVRLGQIGVLVLIAVVLARAAAASAASYAGRRG